MTPSLSSHTVDDCIHLQHLKKNFGNNPVLKDLSLTVKRGEILALIGRSGVGKTVLLKCIISLMSPDSGTITVKPAQHGEHVRFGMQFQKSGLFDSLPVWENIAFRYLQDKSLTRKQACEKAINQLKAVGLSPDVAFLYPSSLSGGMQKRVGFARAIITSPPVLLLDEPTAGLDPVMTSVINTIIVKLVRQTKATALMVTSNMASALNISDRIALLDDGKIVWQGRPQDARTASHTLLHRLLQGRHKKQE